MLSIKVKILIIPTNEGEETIFFSFEKGYTNLKIVQNPPLGMGLVSSVINFNPILSSSGFVLIFRNTGITARLKFFHDAVKKYNDTFSHVPKLHSQRRDHWYLLLASLITALYNILH